MTKMLTGCLRATKVGIFAVKDQNGLFVKCGKYETQSFYVIFFFRSFYLIILLYSSITHSFLSCFFTFLLSFSFHFCIFSLSVCRSSSLTLLLSFLSPSIHNLSFLAFLLSLIFSFFRFCSFLAFFSYNISNYSCLPTIDSR